MLTSCTTLTANFLSSSGILMVLCTSLRKASAAGDEEEGIFVVGNDGDEAEGGQLRTATTPGCIEGLLRSFWFWAF